MQCTIVKSWYEIWVTPSESTTTVLLNLNRAMVASTHINNLTFTFRRLSDRCNGGVIHVLAKFQRRKTEIAWWTFRVIDYLFCEFGGLKFRRKLEKYSKAYEALKPSRKLVWKNNLGTVELDLELDSKTVSFTCTPFQATIIMHFQEKGMYYVHLLLFELWFNSNSCGVSFSFELKLFPNCCKLC